MIVIEKTTEKDSHTERKKNHTEVWISNVSILHVAGALQTVKKMCKSANILVLGRLSSVQNEACILDHHTYTVGYSYKCSSSVIWSLLIHTRSINRSKHGELNNELV